jgi:hypothetical protein
MPCYQISKFVKNISFLQNLKWKNANRKELPAHGDLVLISANGVYYLATFSDPELTFTVQEEGEKRVFSIEDHQIYWTEFMENT